MRLCYTCTTAWYIVFRLLFQAPQLSPGLFISNYRTKMSWRLYIKPQFSRSNASTLKTRDYIMQIMACSLADVVENIIKSTKNVRMHI